MKSVMNKWNEVPVHSTIDYSKVFTTTYDPERLSLAKYTKADGSVFYIDTHCYMVREREFRGVLEIFLTTLDKSLAPRARMVDQEMLLYALLIRSMIDFEGADIEACSLFFGMPESLVQKLYECVLHVDMHLK